MDGDVDLSYIEINDNRLENRIEAIVGNRLAIIRYSRSKDRISFIHTAVPPEISGQGIAGKMAKFALELARENSLQVVPICPFIASYIERHPEYQDLVY